MARPGVVGRGNGEVKVLPMVEELGVPLIVAVPLPLSTNVTPAGNAPVSVRVERGLDEATTVNESAWPTMNRAVEAVMIEGPVGGDSIAPRSTPLVSDRGNPGPRWSVVSPKLTATVADPESISPSSRAGASRRRSAVVLERAELRDDRGGDDAGTDGAPLIAMLSRTRFAWPLTVPPLLARSLAPAAAPDKIELSRSQGGRTPLGGDPGGCRRRRRAAAPPTPPAPAVRMLLARVESTMVS